MEFIDDSYFSEDQKWVIHLRMTEKLSYRQIQSAWKTAHRSENDSYLSASALKTCLKRSALALKWIKGKTYGNETYLSKPDIQILSEYISDRCDESNPSDTSDILAEALLIRKERKCKAIKFLKNIGCDNIVNDLESEDFQEPVRSWINQNLIELHAKIKSARVVDSERYFSCTTEIIISFFQISSEILKDVEPALIFGADELGLDASINKKYVVSQDVMEFIAQNETAQLPHISVMLAHNCIGAAVTPFIILSDLQNCPDELNKYIKNGQIWACSTPSGWQTRDTFLLWCINFINWLSQYRLSLDESINSDRAVLIMDGHTSRENPLALYILKLNNIDVLILPSHCTHLLQMFDVVLASPFKKKFSKLFNKLFNKNCLLNYKSYAALIRDCAINAVIKTWNEICTINNCETAAQSTGTFPQDLDLILSSPFIHDLTDEEKIAQKKKKKRNRLNINGKVVTTFDNLNEINNAIYEKETFRHLCLYHDIDYIPLCHELQTYEFENARLFTKFHPFISESSEPVFF